MTAIGGNGFSDETIGSYVQRYLRLEEDFASEKGRLMAILRADKDALLSEAKDIGINKKVLKKVISKWKKLSEVSAIDSEMDSDEAAEFEMMFEAAQRALGAFADTPLGQAALAAAKPKQDDRQTDLEDFTKDEEESDPEVDAFMDKTHAERVAEAAE